MEAHNGKTWIVKKWVVILTLIVLLGTIIGQILLAQGWKVNVDRDLKDRPTYEQTREIIKAELLDIKTDLKEMKYDIKDLIKAKK